MTHIVIHHLIHHSICLYMHCIIHCPELKVIKKLERLVDYVVLKVVLLHRSAELALQHIVGHHISMCLHSSMRKTKGSRGDDTLV